MHMYMYRVLHLEYTHKHVHDVCTVLYLKLWPQCLPIGHGQPVMYMYFHMSSQTPDLANTGDEQL